MIQGFWKNIKKPILALAPMANVTDAAFRRVIAQYGKPDVMWTEFVSCEGLCSEGRKALMPDLWFTNKERPIVAQIFGAKPDQFYECARLIAALDFDGIDINMGCPDKAVMKQGAGAALIKNPKLAKEIIRATQAGAGTLPVSVKTRIGDTKNTLKEWLPHLLETELAAITIHARTRKEMSAVPAHWDVIREAVAIRNTHDQKTLILGNGDVASREEALRRIEETGADGIMIGRGIFGNPWLFNREVAISELPLQERLQVMLEHTKLFETIFKGIKNFDIMKKHYKAYITGFSGARELRARCMTAKNFEEVKHIIETAL